MIRLICENWKPTFFTVLILGTMVLGCENKWENAIIGETAQDGGDLDIEVEMEEEEAPACCNGKDVGVDPVVFIDSLMIDPDGIGNDLSVRAEIENPVLESEIDDGKLLQLLRFKGLEKLPASGEETEIDLEYFQASDDDGWLGNNLNGEPFTVLEEWLDDDGNPKVVFENAMVSAIAGGGVRISFNANPFVLNIDELIQIEIGEIEIEATLSPAIDSTGLLVQHGAISGALPCYVAYLFGGADKLEACNSAIGDGDADFESGAEDEGHTRFSARFKFTAVPASLVMPD